MGSGRGEMIRVEWVEAFRAEFFRAARRLWEARRRVAREEAVARWVREVERAVAAAFLVQGRAVAARLERMRARWPVAEGVKETGPSTALRSAQDASTAAPSTAAAASAQGASAQGASAQDDIVAVREAVAGWDDGWDGLWDEAAQEGDGDLIDAIVAAAKAALAAGAQSLLGLVAEEVLAQVGVSWSVDNPAAVDYLRAHGAELVTRIDEATRDDLRSLIEAAMRDGRTYDQLAEDIQRKFASYGDPNSYWRWDASRPQQHIDSRAHLVAVTELGNAYEEGEFEAALELQRAGLTVVKWWSTMGDDRVSALCQGNEADGEIPVDQPHASGDLHPLGHPACRCTENYEVR